MSGFTYTVALLMGFTGSLHCAGMCGPIMWILPFQALQGLKRWLAIALYHTGRISTYALIAFILHSFKVFFNPKWQQYFSVAAGGTLLLMGIFSFYPGSKLKLQLPWVKFVQDKLWYFIRYPKVH